jgi:hypothetical protein
MQPSTTTIFGLPRSLCSARTSLSPISGAPKSKKPSRWRGPATENYGSHLPLIRHNTQRLCRPTNGQPQVHGRTFPSSQVTALLRIRLLRHRKWPIWPTKLLPAIASARLVALASPKLARDDRDSRVGANYRKLLSKCGSSRVLLAKTHCVKQGRGGPRRLSWAGAVRRCHLRSGSASSWSCGVFLCTWLCVFAPQTGFMRGVGGRWSPSVSKVKTPPP